MQLSEEEEDYNLSLSKFESMLKTNKVLFFDSEEFEEIILHYLDIGKLNLAKKALKLALEQHPKSSGLKLVQVEMLIFEDKLDVAEKMLHELYAIEPHNEEIYILKANIYSKKDQHEKAVELLQMALKYTDDLADVYNLIGMEYLFMDNFEKAKFHFIQCLESDIEDQSSLYNIVYCFEILEQNQEAIDYLKNYTEKNPYSEIAWHQIGRLEFGLKNYVQAIRAFEFATYIDDEFVGAYIEIAKAYEKIKNYEKAIVNYQITLELSDPSSFALLRIGRCYEKLDHKTKAFEYYEKTVHEDPLLDKAWIAMADFFMAQKKYAKSIFYINKALAIDNKNKLYWKRFATANRYLKRHEEAEFGYRKAVENGDYQLDTWLYWIDVLYKMDEIKLAIQTLILATEYFPDHCEIEYRLAGLYDQLDCAIETQFHLVNALKIDYKKRSILKKLFPDFYQDEQVQQVFFNFKHHFYD
ncbi:hypothetical protein B0A58_00110 [Flavobacterium branchiophilum NBRC 15030 = ATCC 35035]|uniref:Tetratricopeptide repeat protein n=1 Tax=Flavobacterium branchiophilum TaxID=55197 RepID=A0A543G0F8_9FLAO|nr:tetratricopeptide repeat protein [Flavobacterium branchiophilum]OXA82414.1 hypothetical protein B0A58_00110 [Flavobacterium branchiophilum NBRC 15030 = ATCC 35035]TQM39569.1 tetratricopeptide repeat protein [Flavobacterium branchiophilum]GEM56065.1 hypothetical protein FB1_22860 [Flavobacterium branchiophilum NBRC 15030 = ATCC 35035]